MTAPATAATPIEVETDVIDGPSFRADEILVRQPAEEVQHVADARQVGADEEIRLAFAQRRVEAKPLPDIELHGRRLSIQRRAIGGE